MPIRLSGKYVYASPTSVEIIAQADSIAGDPVLPGFQRALKPLFGDGRIVPESTPPGAIGEE